MVLFGYPNPQERSPAPGTLLLTSLEVSLSVRPHLETVILPVGDIDAA